MLMSEGKQITAWGLTDGFSSTTFYHNGGGGQPGSFSTYGGLQNLQNAASGSLQSLNFVGLSGEPVDGATFGSSSSLNNYDNTSGLLKNLSASSDNLNNFNTYQSGTARSSQYSTVAGKPPHSAFSESSLKR